MTQPLGQWAPTRGERKGQGDPERLRQAVFPFVQAECQKGSEFCLLGTSVPLPCSVSEGSEKLAEAARTPCSESVCPMTLDQSHYLINNFLLSPTMCLVCAESRQDGLPALWALVG